MRTAPSSYSVLLVSLLAWPAIASAAPRERVRLPPGPLGFADVFGEGIRGVTVGPIESSQQPGRGYGSPYSERLLDHLEAMGVNWVSITPFGRVYQLTSTDIRMDFELPYEENREGVKRFIAQAHARGIRVLLIPHLWVETGGWRGEMEPGTPEGWARYQASYRAFLLAWARDAADAGADALSIGVECKSWSGRFGAVWTSMIADVRAVFPGLLTYSANWDEAENVLFWDQLDLVGINAFYPLADHAGATDDEYRAGALRNVETVRDLGERLEMPVLFVEIGYTTREDAAIEPWIWPDGMENVVISEHEQARALDALFDAFLPEPWFVGFFVWRYYNNLDDVSQEGIWGFSPHAKQAEPLLERVFAYRWGSDADALPFSPPPYASFDDHLGDPRVFAPFSLP